MSTHVNHILKNCHFSFDVVWAKPFSDIWEALTCVRTATDRMDLRESLRILSQKALENEDVRRSNEGKDIATVSRRVTKYVLLHIGALYASLCNTSY